MGQPSSERHVVVDDLGRCSEQEASGHGVWEGQKVVSQTQSLAFPLPSSLIAVHALPGKWRCWSPACLLERISGRSALERIVSPCHLIF